MQSLDGKRIPTILQLVKGIVVFISGGIVVHILIMEFEYLLASPLYLNLHTNFVSSAIFAPMIPMIGAYGTLSLYRRGHKNISF
ncbi:MAG: hypothetical protein ACYSR9_00145 [Planctomycetota bacterium]|jgi:hypothetical protein